MTDEMVASDSAVAGQGDARHRWDRIALGVIAIATLPVGLQAAFTPRSFYNDFPLGRHWIALDGGAYNEHLVRDVGVLFLALILVTGWVVIRRLPTQSVAAAWLLQGTLHVIHHAQRHAGQLQRLATTQFITNTMKNEQSGAVHFLTPFRNHGRGAIGGIYNARDIQLLFFDGLFQIFAINEHEFRLSNQLGE